MGNDENILGPLHAECFRHQTNWAQHPQRNLVVEKIHIDRTFSICRGGFLANETRIARGVSNSCARVQSMLTDPEAIHFRVASTGRQFILAMRRGFVSVNARSARIAVSSKNTSTKNIYCK